MDLRALLFGSTLKTAVTVVVALGLVLGGAVVAGVLGAPSVAAMDNDFGPVNATETTILTDLVVHNPNPIAVRLGGLTVDYTVAMNGIEMANGTERGIRIGTGNSTVELTTYLHNEKIPAWWVSHVRNGEETTLVVRTDVHSGLLGRTVHYATAPRTISTDVIGQFNSTENRPVNANVAVVSDPLLVVRETSANWGEVTRERTPIRMSFTVHNPKDYPVTVSRLGYDVTMNGVAVGSGETRSGVTIPPHATRRVRATTVIRNQKLDEWWVTHLERGQRTRFRIDFYAVVDTGATGSFRIPMRGFTYEKTIETDIFQETETGGANATTTGTTSDTTTADTTTTTETTTETTTTTTTEETLTTATTTTTTTTTEETTNTTTDDDLLAIGGRSPAVS